MYLNKNIIVKGKVEKERSEEPVTHSLIVQVECTILLISF